MALSIPTGAWNWGSLNTSVGLPVTGNPIADQQAYMGYSSSLSDGIAGLGSMVSADPWNSYGVQDFGKLFGLNQGSGVLAPVFGGHYNQLGAGMSNLSGLVR